MQLLASIYNLVYDISARVKQSSVCTSNIEDGSLLARHQVPQGYDTHIDSELIQEVMTRICRVEGMTTVLGSDGLLVQLARSQEDSYETSTNWPVLDALDSP